MPSSRAYVCASEESLKSALEYDADPPPQGKSGLRGRTHGPGARRCLSVLHFTALTRVEVVDLVLNGFFPPTKASDLPLEGSAQSTGPR